MNPRVVLGASVLLLSLISGSIGSFNSVFSNSRLTHPAPVGQSDDRQVPPGPLGEQIRLGQELINDTARHPMTRDYVGNQLTCSSCHLDAGKHATAASFIGVATAYPAYAPREKRVITLEDRILNCFMRSMNGKRPKNGGPVSTAMATYITWLSQGQPMKMNPDHSLGPGHLKPLDAGVRTFDLANGKTIYENQCADCHGLQGEGTGDGPAVWGDLSYNQGAGFYRNAKLGSWIKVAMPLDDASLTDQEALDVAAYLNRQPHPQFQLEDHQ